MQAFCRRGALSDAIVRTKHSYSDIALVYKEIADKLSVSMQGTCNPPYTILFSRSNLAKELKLFLKNVRVNKS